MCFRKKKKKTPTFLSNVSLNLARWPWWAEISASEQSTLTTPVLKPLSRFPCSFPKSGQRWCATSAAGVLPLSFRLLAYPRAWRTYWLQLTRALIGWLHSTILHLKWTVNRLRTVLDLRNTVGILETRMRRLIFVSRYHTRILPSNLQNLAISIN